MHAIRAWLRKGLESKGYVLFNTKAPGLYAQDGIFTFNNSHFSEDSRFKRAYRRGILASQGVDPRIEWRLHVALWAAMCPVTVPGDFVECGVNAGFISSAIIERLQWQTVNKLFVLIDTFCGPPLSQYSPEEVTRGQRKIAEDAIRGGAYVTDLSVVSANYAEWPNTKLVRGIVPDVLEQLAVDRVAFLHLDMNSAYPERSAFEYFRTRLSPGGIVLLDDYSAYGYDATTKALDAAAA